MDGVVLVQNGTGDFLIAPSLLPESFRLDNFTQLVRDWPYRSWYGDSMTVATLSTHGVPFIWLLAGFAFAKYHFRGKSALFALMLGSSMIPFPIISVSRLGRTSLNLALILPFLASAIGIFLKYLVGRNSGFSPALRGRDGGGDARIDSRYCGVHLLAALLYSGLDSWGGEAVSCRADLDGVI